MLCAWLKQTRRASAGLGLCNSVRLAIVVRPHVARRRAVPKAHIRQQPAGMRSILEGLKHGCTTDMVVRPYAIHGKHGCFAFGHESVRCCKVWTSASEPDRVDKAYWKGQHASSKHVENCWAKVRDTSLRRKSPTTKPRAPPDCFRSATSRPRPNQDATRDGTARFRPGFPTSTSQTAWCGWLRGSVSCCNVALSPGANGSDKSACRTEESSPNLASRIARDELGISRSSAGTETVRGCNKFLPVASGKNLEAGRVMDEFQGKLERLAQTSLEEVWWGPEQPTWEAEHCFNIKTVQRRQGSLKAVPL